MVQNRSGYEPSYHQRSKTTIYRSARIIRFGGSKIDGTLPTAQTPGPNWRILSEASKGFLNFILEAKIIIFFVAHFRVFSNPPKGSKISMKALISQLLRRNSKIPSMPLKVSSWGASTKNLSQFGPGVWAVRGGAIDFGPTTSCNSGTSVEGFIEMNSPLLRRFRAESKRSL